MFVYSIFVVSYVGIWDKIFPNYDQDCSKIPWTRPLTFNEFSEILLFSTLFQLYRSVPEPKIFNFCVWIILDFYRKLSDLF